MRLNLPPEAIPDESATLETVRQHSDGDHHQQSINPLCFPQTTARQLVDPGFPIAEQLLTAEALGVAPDQIERRFSVADQVPGVLHRQAGGASPAPGSLSGSHQPRAVGHGIPDSAKEGSANFSEAAQRHNFEAGWLVREPRRADMINKHFQQLIADGHFAQPQPSVPQQARK